MAKLTTYTAPVTAPDTTFQRATPQSMGADIGAGLETISKGANHFYTQMEEDEARSALVATTQIRAKYAAALDEATVSGADMASLKEKMADELSAVGEKFNTKRGLDSLALHTAQSNIMFDDQANRIAVTRASETARLQGQQFLQSESATLRSNPSYLSIAERNVDDFVSTLVNVPPAKRALVAQDLKTQLNMAAVQASARIDPEGTKRRLNEGEWNLTPREREQGIAEAETQLRAIRSDEIHQRQLAEYELHKADAEASDLLLKKIVTGTIQPGEIINDPDLLRPTRENLIHFQAWLAEDRLNRANKPHPEEMLRLWNIIHADAEDPNKVYNGNDVIKSALGKKLNAVEAERALSWVSNQKDENNRSIGAKLTVAMSEVGRAVAADPAFIGQPAVVAGIQMDYQARVLERVSDLRKANENPNQVFDPKNKNYVGSREFIQQSIDAVRAQTRLNAVKAGETVVRDGVTWQFQGGDPKLPANWKQVSTGSSLVNQIPQ